MVGYTASYVRTEHGYMGQHVQQAIPEPEHLVEAL
jgi:hypothetical protein